MTAAALSSALACAALHPGLRSVLVFDLSAWAFTEAAQQFAALIHASTGHQPHRLALGLSTSEERLWGHWTLADGADTGCKPKWQSPLFPDTGDPAPCLILIPDLTQLNLHALRSITMLAQTDAAHLERHGHSRVARPRLYWLAALAGSDSGAVSPHVLDRFVLRLNYPPFDQKAQAAWLKQHLPASPNRENGKIGQELRDTLRRGFIPTLDEAALARVSAYFPAVAQGTRRELSLARLAGALAALQGDTASTVTHVDQAATLIGLAPVSPTPLPRTSQEAVTEKKPDNPLKKEGPVEPTPSSNPDPKPAASTQWSSEIQGGTPVYPSNQTDTAYSLDLPATPYPEDEAPVLREAHCLRLPPGQRQSAVRAVRGQSVGVQPSTVLNDVAWTATFLEAAKFSPIRRGNLLKHIEKDERDGRNTARLRALLGQALQFLPTDLRRHRRMPAPEHVLVVVLDYTCRQGTDWQTALSPYLYWAYTQRAGICLVQVGAAGDAAQEKRAQRIEVRSLLVPRLSQSLEAAPGRATPLAHGLDLALDTLRRQLQHGRKQTRQARLVVFSDGRGNVPLESSRANTPITAPVNQRGVTDALDIAAKLCGLHRLESFLLNPQPRYYPQLPLDLARTLGAGVVEVPAAPEDNGV